jgi:hypothetical protein
MRFRVPQGRTLFERKNVRRHPLDSVVKVLASAKSIVELSVGGRLAIVWLSG